MGVSIDQWRGRIGRFNILRTPHRAPMERCSTFLIFDHLMAYLNFSREYLLFPLIIIKNIIFLFSFCFTAITVFSLATLFRTGIWILIPDTHPSVEDVSIILNLVITAPSLIPLVTTKGISAAGPMANIAFRLSVIGILLLMAGIESNPGPNDKRNLSFAVWNLDSLPARDFARIPLLESFQAED